MFQSSHFLPFSAKGQFSLPVSSSHYITLQHNYFICIENRIGRWKEDNCAEKKKEFQLGDLQWKLDSVFFPCRIKMQNLCLFSNWISLAELYSYVPMRCEKNKKKWYQQTFMKYILFNQQIFKCWFFPETGLGPQTFWKGNALSLPHFTLDRWSAIHSVQRKRKESSHQALNMRLW